MPNPSTEMPNPMAPVANKEMLSKNGLLKIGCNIAVAGGCGVLTQLLLNGALGFFVAPAVYAGLQHTNLFNHVAARIKKLGAAPEAPASTEAAKPASP